MGYFLNLTPVQPAQYSFVIGRWLEFPYNNSNSLTLDLRRANPSYRKIVPDEICSHMTASAARYKFHTPYISNSQEKSTVIGNSLYKKLQI